MGGFVRFLLHKFALIEMQVQILVDYSIQSFIFDEEK
jgi:hypothetical protein